MKNVSIVLLVLSITCSVYAQTITEVYDGLIGIEHTFENDSFNIIAVAKGRAAERCGLQVNDIIIEIDGEKITGVDKNINDIDPLFKGSGGQPIDFRIKRPGIDSLFNVILIRDISLSLTSICEYEYLVDTTGNWSIHDIASDSIQKLFTYPLENKILVYSVTEGEIGDDLGMIPGDKILSLKDDLFFFDLIDNGGFISEDTLLIFLRDSVEIRKEIDKKRITDLGIISQYGHDLNQKNIWIKVTTSNMISEDRSYLLEFMYYDSVFLYQPDRSGSFILKKTGTRIPAGERDYLLGDYTAIQVVLKKDEQQIFYINIFKRSKDDFPPYIYFTAVDYVIQFDRLKRIITGIVWGMLLIIAFYYIILYIFIRERSYIFYVLFIISFGIFLLYDSGYGDELIWANSVNIFNKLEYLFLGLPFIFLLLFGSNYLNLHKKLRSWYKIILANLLMIILSLTIITISDLLNPIYYSYSGFLIVVDIIFVASVIIALVILITPAILRIRQRFNPGWYFLIATIIMLTFFAYNEFSIPGLFSSDLSKTIISSSFYFGVVAQFLVLSVGLGQKIKTTERARQLAQESMIEQLRENEKLKDKVNRELEQKVQERTQEINMQKEEIESQRDELEKQRDVVTHQKGELTDSIIYASRIQHAVMPAEELLDELLPEHFVLFNPKDVVSGDFYWIRQVKNFTVVVAADCTGHGVPGAFMSMLGISFLNEIVSRSRFDNAGEFLDRLRKKVKITLDQKGKIFEQKDGMDMSLLILDKDHQEMQYAGAFNPLFLIRNSDFTLDDDLSKLVKLKTEHHNLIEIKGCPQPIAIHERECDFQTHTLKLEKGDTLYIFSDGYPDQMGGPKGKKFMIRKFKQLLLDIQSESLAKQKDILDQILSDWIGDVEQIDDILVFGIRWK